MVPLVTKPICFSPLYTGIPARMTPLSSRVMGRMRRGRSVRSEKSRFWMRLKAAYWRSRASRPMKSLFCPEKLTANLARGTAKMGISFPSGSAPISWP